MPTPTIDLNQIADGVTAVLNARAHEARAQQRDAERLATEQAQREAERAARAQRATVCAEFERLSALQQSLKTELETKRANLEKIIRELPVLGERFSALLGELGRMQARYDFLKGKL